MAGPAVAGYGSWRSPITSEAIVRAGVRLGEVRLDGETVYWAEGRPIEGGRSVVVRRAPDGSTTDLNPPPFNARTRVYEYAGGAWCVADGVLYFNHFGDGRLYRRESGTDPGAITAAGATGYADFTVDSRRARLIGLREDPAAEGEPVHRIVAVPFDGGAEQVLVEGRDFYAAPRLSPDGTQLAWLAWSHPNMPWDGTELWVGELDSSGLPHSARRVAGGPTESIFQPEWSPDGRLYFVSDRTGWWNLYRLGPGDAAEPLWPVEAELGEPQWVLGLSTYAFLSPGEILCVVNEKNVESLVRLDTETGAARRLDTPYTAFSSLRAAAGQAVFTAAAPTLPRCVVRLDAETEALEVLRCGTDWVPEERYLSVPEAIEFPTAGGQTAHAFFYPPRNDDFVALEGERPPVLVIIHGGPTSAAFSTLALGTQYWTSRGMAVLDVNYRGSTGYGRAYRELLYGRWGIADVEDCVAGVRYLAGQGRIDPARAAITGGSAGGYTTLVALTTTDVFRAGASHFGVSDLEALARDTHKFESRYLDRLIGPYPERADLYRDRSPIHHVDGLSCPVIFFQGLDDKVVPPRQAELMVEALRAKGLPVAYVAFEGEQHGFRKAENIRRALDGELYFYSRVFGFPLADPVDPVPIENLPEGQA